MSVCFIAHRGYSGRYLQNTEEAFLKAVEHGSGGIETDVRITRDGVLVVNHNSEARFADGTEMEISSHTYAELSAKPLANPYTDTDLRICTFRRYLEICRDGHMVCFIEFKGNFPDEKIVEAFRLAEEIYELSMCSLQSFDFDNLIRAHRLFPKLGIMLTAGSDCGAEEISRCIDAGFDIDMAWDYITDDIVSRFHEKGLKVGLWTANKKEVLDFCLAKNVDYIESDFFADAAGN